MGLKRCPSFSKRPGFPCGLRVLLVEADTSARSSAELLLKDCNYSVTTCSSTTEALTCLTSSSYDVLLADKSMVTGQAQDRQQLLDSSKGLPCILMAQDPSPADIMNGIQLGAVDILAKPLSPLKLQNIWQHTVRKLMGNMNINCTTEQQAAAAAAGAAAAEQASAAAAAAVKKELDEMEVILEEPECEEAAQQADGQPAVSNAVKDNSTSVVGNSSRPVVNTAANVALATASSFYEPTKSLSRSASSAASESCIGGSSPSSPSCKAGLAGNKRASTSKHAPVHSCPSTRSLNSMSSCYSSLQLAVPQSPSSPFADAATEAAEEAGNGPQSSAVPAAAPSSSPSPCPLQQQRSIKKAVRHPTPATPASKPPLNPGSAAAAKAQAAQQQGVGAMGPGCGATAAGPLPTGTMGLTSVPLPTGLGPLPQGMVWGMPMCPLARAPGIVPPRNNTSSSTAGSSQQQQMGNSSSAAAAASGMMMPGGMPWGMCGVGPMGMPMGMPGLPPPPFMPGFMMPGMPPMPMPFGPFGAAAGMMTPSAAGYAYDPAAQQQQMQAASAQDAAAAAAAPVIALPIAPQMQQQPAAAGSTGASMAAALNASLGGLGSGASDAAADAMDLGDLAFDFMLGDITAEDDLDVGMSGLLDGELAGLEKNGLNLPAELQELQALEVQQQQAAAAACQQQQQRQSFECSAYSSQRMSYDCHASTRQRVSFDCSTASTTTTNRVSFDCSVNNTAGGRGSLARNSSQRVSFEVSCCNSKAAAAAAQGSMTAPAAAAACPSGCEQQQSGKGAAAAAAAAKCSDPLLGSMSDLFAACSGDSCSEGSAGMTHVDSCGMLADLQSLFASDGCAGVRDDGCSTAAAAAAAGLFDDVMDDLPLEMAMKKSSSLADLLAGGLTPMQA